MLVENGEYRVALDDPYRAEDGNPWKELLHVMDSLTDGIFLLDQAKHVVGVNRTAQKMLGWTEEEWQQGFDFCRQVCDGVVSEYNDEGLSNCANCRIFQENCPYVEMVLRKKNGERLAVAASSTVMEAKHDRPVCTVMAIRDISKQKRRAKEHLSQRLSNKLMQALEDERKRISKELHDGIGQSLFGIQMTLNLLKDRFEQLGLEEYYRNLYDMTTQTLEDVRHICTELRPSILDDLGLVPAIRSYVKRMQSSVPFEVTFKYNANVRLDPHIETALFRIFQEGLSNAVKYSEAEQFTVDLSCGENGVTLTIEDDGKGFLPEEIGENGCGLGLLGMKERVAQLNGCIEIDSEIGRGTRIHVALPERGLRQ